jgi:hypothetical protein
VWGAQKECHIAKDCNSQNSTWVSPYSTLPMMIDQHDEVEILIHFHLFLGSYDMKTKSNDHIDSMRSPPWPLSLPFESFPFKVKLNHHRNKN